MVLKPKRITRKEAAFIGHFAATGDVQRSAELAGYASPATAGYDVAARPHVQETSQALQLARLQNEVLPKAVQRHLDLLNDPKVGGQTLNRAIEMAYKYGLGASADGSKKQPHEMTAEELAQAIDTLKRAAADAAKPVLDLEPNQVEAGVFD